jgi:hypothetical protein
VRRITAAVVAGLSVFTAVWESSATATADIQCTGEQGPNPAAPESYQSQYNSSVAKPVTKDLAAYDAAVASGDPKQIWQTAGTLSNDISQTPMIFGNQTPFGCYDPPVLTGLQRATNTFATALDSIKGAAAGLGGKTPSDVPGLVSQAKPQERAYVDALNAYAAQFGGQQVRP